MFRHINLYRLSGQGGDDDEAHMLFVPLIDCSFLVIMFMLAAFVLLPLIRAQQEIEEPEPEPLTPITDQVFVLSEAAGYVFKSGRSEDDEVADRIRTDIVPQIAQRMRDEGFNLVQVVGFTDGTAMNGGSCAGWDHAYAEAVEAGSKLPAPCNNIDLAKLRATFVGNTIYQNLPADITDITIMTSGSGPDQFLGDNPGTSPASGRRRIAVYLLRIGDD